MALTVILADRRDNNQTLAAVLKERLKLPWSKVKQTIERRHVRVGGQIIADAAYRVKTGKRITIAVGAIEKEAKPKVEKPVAVVPTAPRKKRTPLSTAIVIVYSDAAVVVVNKPAGLTTVRSAEDVAEFGSGKQYLPKTLADLLPGAMGEPKAKLLAVHRLDRDTSGLVVFARTSAAAKSLTRQFKVHSVERKYLALVRGTPTGGRLGSLFVDDRGDGRRGSGAKGMKAVTHVTVKETFKEFALVECRLETGRTHQVRIHLGEAGTPLCGETVYDRPIYGKPHADSSAAERPMLHAAVLGFAHPVSGDILHFEAEPPDDFAIVQRRLSANTIPARRPS